MKKIIYSLGLVLLAASCTDDYTDWASPQHNDEEAAKTVALAVEAASPINYENLKTDSVKLFQTTVTAQDPTTNAYDVVLYNADKSQADTLQADNSCQVLAASLQASVEKLYGKRPVQRDIPLTVVGYMSVNGQALKGVGETTAKVTLTAPFIDEAYYLFGTVNNFSKQDQTYKLDNGGGDVYDNPKFSITVPAPKDASGNRVDFEFKIAPQKAYSSADFDKAGIIATVKPEGDNALSGTFSKNNGGYFRQPKSDGAKYYKLEFDMWNATYTITPTNDPELFFTGSKYGWGATWNALTVVNGSTETFWTIVYLDKDEEFKFAPQAGWGNDFGSAATIIDKAGAGLVDASGNLKATKAGWYLLKVTNGATRKVEVLEPNVYLIGDAAGEWNIADSHKFSIPTTADGQFVSPAFAADAEVRMCVSLENTDWWRTEFIVNAAGKIEFRGNGGDQPRVKVKKGQKAYLNFTKGMGEYK